VPGGPSLTVVGTGIGSLRLTLEAQAAIEAADELLYLAADPVTEAWLLKLHPNARNLGEHYRDVPRRDEVYGEIADHLVSRVTAGANVCAAFYGHPGVCVQPSHEAIKRVRELGFPARMLPGISADACLYAELGIDPGQLGCQTFEATDFLVCRRPVDPTSALVLWQVGIVGAAGYPPRPALGAFELLREALLEHYPADHEAVVYEASPYPLVRPIVDRTTIARLAETTIPAGATLFVPPSAAPVADPGRVARLGLSPS
jgi:uncharacterized protein YabN with tetrapyrrole methylase and pyrophosphatase domain